MSGDLVISSPGGDVAAGTAADVLPSVPGSVSQPSTGVASPFTGASAARKAEIEHIMRTDFDRYERELAGEYLSILQAEQETVMPGSTDPLVPMAPDASRRSLEECADGAMLAYRWDQQGGFKANLANVQREAGRIIATLPGYREQRAFMERFDRSVPDYVRARVYAEFALGAPLYVNPVPPAEVKEFATDAIGAELVDYWGPTAPTRIATFQQRVERMTEELSDEAVEALYEWFYAIPHEPAKAIVRRLAGD